MVLLVGGRLLLYLCGMVKDTVLLVFDLVISVTLGKFRLFFKCIEEHQKVQGRPLLHNDNGCILNAVT